MRQHRQKRKQGDMDAQKQNDADDCQHLRNRKQDRKDIAKRDVRDNSLYPFSVRVDDRDLLFHRMLTSSFSRIAQNYKNCNSFVVVLSGKE
jgi:hypothetical protein